MFLVAMVLCTGGSTTVTPQAGCGATKPLNLTSPQQRCAKQSSTLISLWTLSPQALHSICCLMHCQVTPSLDKRLFKPPYSKTLTPPSHPSEVGLPWLSNQDKLAKVSASELTSWGWDLFFSSVLEGNSDVLTLFTPLQAFATTSPLDKNGMRKPSTQSDVMQRKITSSTLNSTRSCLSS